MNTVHFGEGGGGKKKGRSYVTTLDRKRFKSLRFHQSYLNRTMLCFDEFKCVSEFTLISCDFFLPFFLLKLTCQGCPALEVSVIDASTLKGQIEFVFSQADSGSDVLVTSGLLRRLQSILSPL